MKDDFADLSKKMAKLENENYLLKSENQILKKKMSAKRYKVIDSVVDFWYRSRKKSLERLSQKIEQKKKKKGAEREIKTGRVDIVNINFYDWDGKEVFKGGAERYVYDLACLLKEMGLKPRILQCSNKFFKKRFNGIEVIGIGSGSRDNTADNSAMFNYYCKDCEFVIASPLDLACEIKDVPVIGINHGINFDGTWNMYKGNLAGVYDERMKALKNVSSCVCVDTNFINWTRTLDYKYSLKEKFIPNYYDEKQFKVRKTKQKDGQVVFVYPRRIYEARGYDITIEAFRNVFVKYGDKVRLEFVGQIDNEKADSDLKAFMAEFPKNVSHAEYNMEEMTNAYKDADVVLIPTKYCEGTSLSCIEGMVSGAAVVATNVGGLPNLIIDGFNGMLVEPTAESLEAAVVELIKNPKMREKIAENGKMVAREAFGKKRWQEKWKKEIERIRKVVKEGV